MGSGSGRASGALERRVRGWTRSRLDSELRVQAPNRARPRACRLGAARVVRIAPNRAAAPRDSRFGQNERLGDSAIRRFGNS